MIEEFDHVRIISLEKTGVVVDIRNTTKKFYLVELDDDNSLVDCTEHDIVLYSTGKSNTPTATDME